MMNIKRMHDTVYGKTPLQGCLDSFRLGSALFEEGVLGSEMLALVRQNPGPGP